MGKPRGAPEHGAPRVVGLSQRKEITMTERDTSAQRSETDIASERMGRNKLQGDDQSNVHNERQAVPDVKQETDGVIESFEKLDKDHRRRKTSERATAAGSKSSHGA
jgi:hypothetical protein